MISLIAVYESHNFVINLNLPRREKVLSKHQYVYFLISLVMPDIAAYLYKFLIADVNAGFLFSLFAEMLVERVFDACAT